MSETYQNPVYPYNVPDPFVLKFCGEYWAYCTGVQPDGRCFGVLHSPDLVQWRLLGGALERLPEPWPDYWAPELIYDNGRFLMYYSVGNEEHMHIRVAVAEHPAGPFVDSGRRLTAEPFAIDAHVFTDDDGARFLFYATDFLDHSHVGTGTVRDRLLDPFTLAGQPEPVTLPRYDWHVYDPQRASKGGVRWHTVEGPFVLKRKGRYYEMFSGGNWQNPSYGVSYALGDSPARPGEWSQVADGERVLPILRTLPGQVIGPGHNSVVRGPDNRQLFCVYHRWADDLSGRVMAIDRLEWAGERMLILGPSITPQPAPARPAVAGWSGAEALGSGWHTDGGLWSAQDNAALQSAPEGNAAARCLRESTCFLAEVSAQAIEAGPDGAYGLSLHDDAGVALRYLLAPERGQALVAWRGATGWAEQQLPLPDGFAARAFHLLQAIVDGPNVQVSLDQHGLRWQGRLDGAPRYVALDTSNAAAAFAGFELTIGWEDLFEAASNPADVGWHSDEPGRWALHDQQLVAAATAVPAVIAKGPPLDAYELVVNGCLIEGGDDSAYGFYPAWGENGPGPLLVVERAGAGWALVCADEEQRWELPGEFSPFVVQQFRFRKAAGRITLQWEAHLLGTIDAPAGPTGVGLYARGAAAFEMVRVTAS